GGIFAVIRSRRPVTVALAAGIQNFAIGTAFWASRHALLQTPFFTDQFRRDKTGVVIPGSNGINTSRERLYASTITSGISAGAINGLLNGPRAIIPGIVIFSILGYTGQSIYNTLDRRHAENQFSKATQKGPDENILQRAARSKWSPMSVLSNEKYEKMLQEKLLRIEADIAILDENIEKLRKIPRPDDEEGKN
ncbi:hypothetical protein M501DRAFT_936155, partial [Patellaria atrata CBS 101060]